MPKDPSQRSRLTIWYALALMVVAFDQVTKAAILESFAHGDSVTVTTFFKLVRVHNPGAAFSFLSDAGGWQRWFLSGLAAAVSMAIVVWIARLPRSKWLECLALTLILGGALGNLYDRLVLGYVVDFLDFHWAGWHFPAFNVADSAITMGAVLLILDALFTPDGEPNVPSDGEKI